MEIGSGAKLLCVMRVRATTARDSAEARVGGTPQESLGAGWRLFRQVTVVKDDASSEQPQTQLGHEYY